MQGKVKVPVRNLEGHHVQLFPITIIWSCHSHCAAVSSGIYPLNMIRKVYNEYQLYHKTSIWLIVMKNADCLLECMLCCLLEIYWCCGRRLVEGHLEIYMSYVMVLCSTRQYVLAIILITWDLTFWWPKHEDKKFL
jgi:hypothetical protein